MSRDSAGAAAVMGRWRPEILSVTPASGVWAVCRAADVDGHHRYRREPVRVWALVRWHDMRTDVVPMIEGATALELVGESCVWLWNEATGDRCDCGYVNPPSYSAGDRWWCRVCAGLIESS